MKFIYPAVFRPTEDKKYNAFFPDLACCEANGDTLDDAIENANAAAYDWIYTELMEFEGCKGMKKCGIMQVHNGPYMKKVAKQHIFR